MDSFHSRTKYYLSVARNLDVSSWYILSLLHCFIFLFGIVGTAADNLLEPLNKFYSLSLSQFDLIPHEEALFAHFHSMIEPWSFFWATAQFEQHLSEAFLLGFKFLYQALDQLVFKLFVEVLELRQPTVA